jgi:sulfoxide reductase catalytic subunit YedY
MLIRQKSSSYIASSEITPEGIYLNRRTVLEGMGVAALSLALPAVSLPALALPPAEDERTPAWLRKQISARKLFTGKPVDALTPYEHVTGYNNFYEFGFEKSDPARYEKEFKAHPWKVEITGEVEKPGIYHLEDFLKPYRLEDRIYRLRCVEAWSMVVPWLGFPLKSLLDRVGPKSAARYVVFITLNDQAQFPALADGSFAGPYIEGLRLDEALHPLSLMAVGVYGRSLPAQNGAPLRLVVPWKYGFKSIKSIVRISFERNEPRTTWNRLAPEEYGFYANVNPKVDHPRWSQARERALPNTLFKPNWKDTQPFNGYADQVASLYTGMDLKKNY